MIRRSTWIAILVFAAVLAAALLWNRSLDNAAPPLTPSPGPEPLWTVPAESLESFEIHAHGQDQSVAAARDSDHGWMLTQPERAPAQAGLVEQAVTSLLSPIPSRVLEASGLDQFGLDEPDYRITLVLDSGQAYELLVGDRAPTGSGYYVMLPGGGPVYLLSTFVLDTALGFVDTPPVVEPTPTADPSESGSPDSQNGD